LARRFRPVFARIAEDAVRREQTRELPFEAVKWLREAGFGAVRIPQSYGGGGATLPELFRLLIELGEADSNVSHLLRGHFAFLEGRLNHHDVETRDFWFPKVVQGTLIGYAMAERSEGTGGTASLTREDGKWILHGKKYYSTGTIYADWIVAAASDNGDRVGAAVPTNAPGVTIEDDWDGFGQRLTGSGTTIFDRVAIPDEHILQRFSESDRRTGAYHKAFLQLVLLATLAGVGRAVLRDGVEFVRAKTRTFGIPGVSSPRTDPLVQRVVGRLSSLSFAADSLVDAAARALQQVHQDGLAGIAEESQYIEAEIQAFQAQQMVIDLILQATTLLFEVGGASATSEARRFDRHWRNARTAASHNPAIQRERALGDYFLNGTVPDGAWDALRKKPASPQNGAADGGE
jgi:alkylation response protein AidB-like acyl-CoA dehydrogenase